MDHKTAELAKNSRAYVKTEFPHTYREEYDQGTIESMDGDFATVRWVLPWEHLSEGEVNHHLLADLEMAQ